MSIDPKPDTFVVENPDALKQAQNDAVNGVIDLLELSD